MTTRALLWCGYVKPPAPSRRRAGEQSEIDTLDFATSVNDIELAVRAAKALGAAQDEIHAFVSRDDLLPADFGQSRHPATVDSLKSTTRAIARHARANDALVFIATNHGVQRGLLTAAPVDEFDDGEGQLLTPDLLDEHLQPLAGPQVLVVASCYSGAFLKLADRRSNRLVLTACADIEPYRFLAEETPRSPFLFELLGTWCGVSLEGCSAPPAQALDSAFAAAEKRLAEAYKTTRPLRSGSAAWP